MRNTNSGELGGAGSRSVRRFDGPDDTRRRNADFPSLGAGVYPGGAHAGGGEAAGRALTRAAFRLRARPAR